MSLIDKYKNAVSKEDAVVTETNEKQEQVNKIYDEPAKVEGKEKGETVETKETSTTNDDTNAVQGEKDNGKVSTENDGATVADITMRETVKDVNVPGEKVVADETKITQQGPDSQIDQTTEPTEGAEKTGEETKNDGTPDEPAQKELATGSVEALVSDLVKVLNNNPSLEAQNPFVIQSLRTIDNARGFNASKHSYKHFKSLKQVRTALEGLLNQLTK
jgi:hypothetical protein